MTFKEEPIMAKKNYHTHGNTAYAPEEHSIPKRAPSPQKRPNTQRPVSRRPVQLRQSQKIPLDGVAGFLCIGILAASLMSSHAQLITSSDQVVQLRNELNVLESDQKRLSTQYEKYFEIQRIEEILGDDMMIPNNEQVVYIDLSQPDSVTIIGQDGEDTPSLWDRILNLFR